MNSKIKTEITWTESNKDSDKKNRGRKHTKARSHVSLKKKWESKVMHGHYIRSIDRKLISEKDMFLWLS